MYGLHAPAPNWLLIDVFPFPFSLGVNYFEGQKHINLLDVLSMCLCP